MKRLEYIAAATVAKKAKRYENLIPTTPETTIIALSTPETSIVAQPKVFCTTCTSKSFLDSSSLRIGQWKPVDEIKLGRDSRADTSYQYILSMLPEDMVYELSHRLAQEMRNENEDATLDEL